MLDLDESTKFREVPHATQSTWEQYGLPRHAKRIEADAIYSHAECGPLWGPPLLLHVPEDPFVRWQSAGADTRREQVRRVYQRATIRRGLHHAAALATSSSAGQSALTHRFGLPAGSIALVPLGADLTVFHPEAGAIREDGIFHLSSTEARDMTTVVVRAYAQALSLAPDLPDLVIAGNLGAQGRKVHEAARACGVDQRLCLLGRISDEELRRRYATAAVCVQPSLYEGFGLQPLEALACGAPLVVFPEPAVVEVVGQAALVTHHCDDTSLARSIAELWCDEPRRSHLRRCGPPRAAELSWQRTATLLADLLVELKCR